MFFNDDAQKIEKALHKFFESKQHFVGIPQGDDFAWDVACDTAKVNGAGYSKQDRSDLIERVKSNFAKTSFENALAEGKGRKPHFNPFSSALTAEQAKVDAQQKAEAKKADESMNVFRRTSGDGLTR